MPAAQTILFGMASVIAAWGAVFAACLGFGIVLFPRARGAVFERRNLWLCFWSGWGLFLLFLQVWHLFFAVNLLTGLVWVILGWTLLWVSTKELRERKSPAERVPRSMTSSPGQRKSADIIFGLICLAVIIWIANRAMGPLVNGDSGLYHLGSVRWNATYPIITGLGNLHTWYGYNSAYFLYAAVFEAPVWLESTGFSSLPAFRGFAYHFANGLLLAALSLTLLDSLFALALRRSKVQNTDLFQSIFVIFLPYLFFEYASSLANDLGTFSLGVVLGGALCRLLFDHDSPEEKSWLRTNILIFAAAGLSVKLSFAALGGSAAIVALTSHVGGQRRSRKPIVTRAEWKWMIPVVLAAIWIGRGYIQTGYPAFPATVGGIPVRWQVPAANAENERRWISSWAREPYKDPDEVLGRWDWFYPKLKKGLNRLPEFLLPMGIFISSTGSYLLRKRRSRDSAQLPSPAQAGMLIAPAVIAIAFWFFSSPNIRFVGASFWWLAASGIVLNQPSEAAVRRLVWSVTVLALGLFLSLSRVNGFWISPGLDRGFIPAPAAATSTFLTNSGLVLNVPLEGDRCWDAPIPCSPYPVRNLELIRPGDPGGGFVLQK